ncbi:DUF4231 domain-containing protein [Corynebacterium sp. YIM 101645]|uniref:DUF4231 domain-containing protein n=1 Tax=Corynebacterium lemuris TaxID=1859292 RepID=A0ABT2FZB7_9CORY|nr:DUF4231 domain-containing protein [Corynebacterium lemuris]MCS5479808.1 DUF4231 domain-containing protein [Corynebacterium lemuris]
MIDIDPPEIYRLRLRRERAKRNVILAVTAIITMVGAAIVIPMIVLGLVGPGPAGPVAGILAALAVVGTIVAVFVIFDQSSDFQRYDIDLKYELHKTAWKEHQALRSELDQIIREELQSEGRGLFDEVLDRERNVIKEWQEAVKRLGRGGPL